MRHGLSSLLAAVVVLAWTAVAQAELCPQCKGKMYIMSIGQCTSCDGHTTSGAFKLCPKCSAKLGKCEHCLALLAGAAKPAPDKPEEKPEPIDMTRSGKYTSGKWEYELTVDHLRGDHGREGWLKYEGRHVPRGDRGDYYQTPWGPIAWVPVDRKGDVPEGGWGWLPSGVQRQGKRLVPPDSEPAAVELTDADAGKTIRLPVGKVLLISLKGNPTTGYSWRTAKIDERLLQEVAKPQYVADAHAPGLVGGGGKFVFRFRGVKPGKAGVQLEYLRPWEKDKPPTKTFSVSVQVTPK